jgi:hypothetical protein
MGSFGSTRNPTDAARGPYTCKYKRRSEQAVSAGNGPHIVTVVTHENSIGTEFQPPPPTLTYLHPLMDSSGECGSADGDVLATADQPSRFRADRYNGGIAFEHAALDIGPRKRYTSNIISLSVGRVSSGLSQV